MAVPGERIARCNERAVSSAPGVRSTRRSGEIDTSGSLGEDRQVVAEEHEGKVVGRGQSTTAR